MMTSLIVSLICIALLTLGGCFLMMWATDTDHGAGVFAVVGGILALLAGLLGAGFLLFNIWFYVGAWHQANIINREYGTNYTQAEVFFASNVIDTVRELHRQRIEVNGNVLGHGEKP